MADKKTNIKSVFGEDTSFQDRQKEAKDTLAQSESKAAETKGNDGSIKASTPDETLQPLSAAGDSKKNPKSKVVIGSSAGMSIALTLMITVAAIIMLSPSLLLINMKEKLSNDLNDALGFYYTTSEKVMAHQLSGGGDCNTYGDDSIQCKFATMSEGLRDRYKGYGFEVSESGAVELGEDDLNTGRVKVSSVRFPGGTTANSGNLYSVANQSEVSRQRIDRVYNPSKGIFHSRGHIERLYDRFHIQQSRLPSGLTQEEVVESFNNNLVRQADYLDKDGRGVFGLHHLAETDDDYWYREVYDHILDKANTHLALGCSMHTYADLGENALRQAKLTTLARFAMQYMTLSDSIKAGRTMQLEQVIGTLAGNLTHVVSEGGESGFSATDMSSYRTPTFHEEPDTGGDRMMNGRDFMLDYSNMLKSVQGVGISTSTYLRSIKNIPATNASVDRTNSSAARDLCLYSMTSAQGDYETASPDRCWLEETIPTAAAFGPRATASVMATYTPLKILFSPNEPPCFSVERHVDLIKSGARSSSEPVKRTSGSYPDRVRDAASDEAQIYELSENIVDGIHSTETMDAIFAGTGVLLGDTAQWLGMQPATTDSLQDYLKRTAPIRMMLAQQNINEAKDAPLDITNPHSFIGSAISDLYGDGKFNSIASLVGRAVSVVPNSIASIANRGVMATTGSDVTYLQDRLLGNAGSCGIENVQSKINVDFSCAVRYSVNEATMQLGVSDVLDFMTSEDSSDDATEGNSEEVQGRDVEYMDGHGDRMKSEDSAASNIPFIDPSSGKPNKDTEYWKFIEYCSNRQTPLGSLGMAVEAREKEYIPDEKDQTDRRTFGAPFYMDQVTEVDNDLESFYGYAWGGAEDYKWLTGEKCQEESEMLNNFRAYTAMCAVHAATSGAKSCWQHDSIALSRDDFPATNGIMYVSE